MDSSDLPLVWHLLKSWWLNLIDPCTFSSIGGTRTGDRVCGSVCFNRLSHSHFGKLGKRNRSRSISTIQRTSLPPATKLGQGYIFTGVCDSVHRGVGVLPHRGGCVLPPGGGGVLPPGGGVLSPREGDSSWGVLPSRGGCFLLGGCFLPGGASSGGCLMETPGTATAAGGTHLTGMHSCCFIVSTLLWRAHHAKGQLKRILWIVYFHPHITGTNPDFIFIPEDSSKTQMDVVVKNVCQIGQPTFSLFFSHSNIWLMNEQLGGTEEQ